MMPFEFHKMRNKKPRPLDEGTAASFDVPNSRAIPLARHCAMRAAMPGSWDRQETGCYPIRRRVPGRLLSFTVHDYTLRLVKHATDVAPRVPDDPCYRPTTAANRWKTPNTQPAEASSQERSHGRRPNHLPRSKGHVAWSAVLRSRRSFAGSAGCWCRPRHHQTSRLNLEHHRVPPINRPVAGKKHGFYNRATQCGPAFRVLQTRGGREYRQKART